MKKPPRGGKRAVSVTFFPEGAKVEVPRGSSLLEAALKAGIGLQSSCGGRGACGKCRVRVVSPTIAPQQVDRRHFTDEELAQGYRIACKVAVTRKMEVEVPASSRLLRGKITLEGIGRRAEVDPTIRKVHLQLSPPTLADQRADLSRVLAALGDSITAPHDLGLLQELPARLREADFGVTAVLADGELVDLEPGDTSGEIYGVAVDVGTTTIVGYLAHLDSGIETAVASLINPQARFGDDVVSRITYAGSGPGGLETLQQQAAEAINEIIDEACREGGVDKTRIYEATLVGNTCMTHLLLGIDPSSLATMPYVAANTAPVSARAAELGIRINPRGRAHVLPNIAGFVGADTVGVILASGLEESTGARVAVDIGTNGEVVVAKDGRMIACSTAAGPAFEGARIKQGMRAASGAIDQVLLVDGELQVHTIDETPAQGICGSGLVDAVAALVELGIVTPAGRMLDAAQAPASAKAFLHRIDAGDQLPRFVLADETESAGGPVYITSRDVRELQLAKGAICAGIMLLLEEMAVELDEVEEILLAGAFGNYIRREAAQAIGLLPNLPPERIRPIGNAAGAGAKLALISAEMRALAKQVARRVEYVELSERQEFYRRFTDAMILAPVEGDWDN